jgi:two-component system, LytTR family, response regulator
MKTEYNCYIVDDKKTDRLVTVSFVRRYPFLKIAGVFENAREALESAERSLPDVLFLDIDMPEFSGLDLRARLDKVPACIFITAYPEYAMQGFEANALDFLTKPLDAERFDRSMDRLHYFLDIHARAELQEHSVQDDSFFIKEGFDRVRIRFNDIVYLEALKDYTRIVTRDRKYCVLVSLGNLVKEKKFSNFIRIHRSYAVQKPYVTKVSARSVLAGQVSLPVGRLYKDALNDLLTP